MGPMLFPTIEFAIFFALLFPVTWLLNERNTAKKWFQVAASYFFYASWDASYTIIPLGSSLFNFVLACAWPGCSSARLRWKPRRPILLRLSWAGINRPYAEASETFLRATRKSED